MASRQSIFRRLQQAFSRKPNLVLTSNESSKSAFQTKRKDIIMSAEPIVLVLGSGPRVGAAVSEAFARGGYKVAVAARKGTDSKTSEGYLSIKVDFANPESISGVFETVKRDLGAAPNVVIYNAAALTPPPDKDSVLSISAASVSSDMNVNVVSPYAAAQEAIKGWNTLPSEMEKIFIYTGNALNELVLPVPMMLNLGMGKSASAHWIGVADSLYSPQGYRFIYADERHGDGKFKGLAVDGEAHGAFYTQLANSAEGVPWHATFVKDTGYVSFK